MGLEPTTWAPPAAVTEVCDPKGLHVIQRGSASLTSALLFQIHFVALPGPCEGEEVTQKVPSCKRLAALSSVSG